MDLTALRGQLARLLRDNGLNSSQYDPSHVTRAITFACDEIAKRSGCTYKETDIPIVAGAVALPASIIGMVRVFWKNGAAMKLLQKSTLEFEDSKNAGWRTLAGTPSTWMDFSGNTLRLNRLPAAGSAIVGYIERPTPMVAPTDSPDARIPAHFHQHLRYAAAAFLLNQAGTMEDIAKADKFMEQFNALIGAGPAPVAATEVDR
jgi:hypothetical protein